MLMNYICFGTNDLEAATRFYDSLFENSGISQVHATERMVYWRGADFTFALAKPFDGQAATHGNGTMLGFQADTSDEVRRLFERVIALGGSSEGEPGQRGPKFSAYVRDLDNNKIAFFD
ncbi:VOC family protein [Maricaulis sp. D1M11]|uniref:VOC family protein n=1 Tax=Maricaulis sp. D1M11 TaxID=3076117 RepID=UPI0039B5FE7D